MARTMSRSRTSSGRRSRPGYESTGSTTARTKESINSVADSICA